ncbi:MAG: DUF916 domain-containing protein [Rhodoluna sp.]|nr:DUF916 domain-containing protein [Rhodoluna sp.]
MSAKPYLYVSRWAASLVFAAFLVIICSPVTAHASASVDGIAVNPATNGGPDKSRTRFDYELNPGQPARDSIYVYNAGSTPQDVNLYARDAFTGSKGDFLVQDEATQPSDVGKWVVFVNNKTTYQLTLKPHEYMTIPFTLLTPASAAPGDHVGAVVASATTKGANLNIVRRVAVRLYARLSGQISPRLIVTNLKVVAQENPINPFSGQATVSYDIENTGNVELAADVKVQPIGGGDIASGSFVETRVTNLLPGSKRRMVVKFKDLFESTAVGARLTYTGVFPTNYKTAQQPRGQELVSSPSFPTAWVIWISLASFLILGLSLLSRRRKSKGKGETRAASDK